MKRRTLIQKEKKKKNKQPEKTNFEFWSICKIGVPL